MPNQAKRRLAADHRERLQQLFVFAGLPIDARSENALHRRWEPQLRDRARHLHCAVARQHTFVEKRLHHLLDEERIAAGAFGD